MTASPLGTQVWSPQLNRQARIIEDAGAQLGEALVRLPYPRRVRRGGEDFLFGLQGAGKDGNGLLPQIKADAPKVKKAIQKLTPHKRERQWFTHQTLPG